MNVDFKQLNITLLSNPLHYLHSWLPGGKLDGAEYCVADLNGGPGDSLKINTKKGVWSDFATGEGGADMISLYAAIKCIKQIEAAKDLIGDVDYKPSPNIKTNKKEFPIDEPKIILPPKDVKLPDFIHFKYGKPVKVWKYVSNTNKLIFFVGRYADAKGKKQIIPWTFSDKGHWINKAMPNNRPLYNLFNIINNPTALVMIVEGEKAADAAQKIAGKNYVVTTWPNGSQAIDKVNWSYLKDRKILFWPDADCEQFNKRTKKSLGRPGIKAAEKIAQILLAQSNSVKIIDTTKAMPEGEGWDAADALDDGWDFDKLKSWAREFLYVATTDKVVEPEVVDSYDPGPEYIPPMIQEPKNVPHGTKPAKESKAGVREWFGLELQLSTNGSPINNVDNAYRYIQNYEKLKDAIWYDEFFRKVFVKWPDEPVREFRESDEVRLLVMAQREINFSALNINNVRNALSLHVTSNVRNEPVDWLNTLKWDGTHRVASFFSDYMGSDETKFNGQVAQNFWISMVARILRPGCKVDNMVILEGAQGAMKSSALNLIAGNWFTEANETFGTKDFYMEMQGNMIIEIPELDSFNKSEVNTVKKVITQRIDKFRPPYARLVQDYPRSCVFVGTTNDDDYLRDPTGARRFWPVRVGKIDIEGIKEDRSQFFAEAVHLFKSGATWYEVDKVAAKKETDRRTQYDVWHNIIADYILEIPQITVYDLLKHAVRKDTDKMNRLDQMRVCNILKQLGWHKGGRTSVGGSSRSVWVNPAPGML